MATSHVTYIRHSSLWHTTHDITTMPWHNFHMAIEILHSYMIAHCHYYLSCKVSALCGNHPWHTINFHYYYIDIASLYGSVKVVYLISLPIDLKKQSQLRMGSA